MASEVWCTAILDRDVFWREELLKIGTDFLFVCGSGVDSKWIRRIESKVKSDHEHRSDEQPGPREGIFANHAYSIMAAREINGQRLLKLRNPFCSGEWTGKWSDGSLEWTPELMQLLDHKFGNDGIFWISYEDLLEMWRSLERTRRFRPEWFDTQCWTSLDVSWRQQWERYEVRPDLEGKHTCGHSAVSAGH